MFSQILPKIVLRWQIFLWSFDNVAPSSYFNFITLSSLAPLSTETNGTTQVHSDATTSQLNYRQALTHTHTTYQFYTELFQCGHHSFSVWGTIPITQGRGSRPTEFTGYPDNLDALLVKYQTRVSHGWQPSRKVSLLAHESTIRRKAWEVRSVVTGRKAEQSRSAPSLQMINGLSSIPFSQFFTFSNNTTTRGHSAKINNWTSEDFSFLKELLIAVTSYIRKTQDSTTLNSFKNCLQQRRKAEMGFFTD